MINNLMNVYFDNAATTPLHPRVFEKMKSFMTEDFGNPSSIHSYGRKTRVAVEEAREVIANFINAIPSEIYFTSGGTEANNFIIHGITQSEFSESGKNEIISSQAEHHSVLDSVFHLSKNGFICNLLNSRNDTSADFQKLPQYLNESTSLVSLIHVNNETGIINPIDKISSIVKSNTTFFHTDAVQSFGKIKIDIQELGIDALSASAHKMNGPKGIGFAFVKSGTPLSPLIYGGSQERNRRGGTENVPAIVGFAEAIKIANKEMIDNFNHVNKLRDEFVKGLLTIGNKKIIINGDKKILPYILSITFLSEYFKNDAEAMLIYLDINGIAASNGAACTSGTLKPSHVILSAGYSESDTSGTIRFSFGSKNTLEEVYYTLDVLKKMVMKFAR
jgi:cysteine desulfurase